MEASFCLAMHFRKTHKNFLLRTYREELPKFPSSELEAILPNCYPFLLRPPFLFSSKASGLIHYWTFKKFFVSKTFKD